MFPSLGSLAVGLARSGHLYLHPILLTNTDNTRGEGGVRLSVITRSLRLRALSLEPPPVIHTVLGGELAGPHSLQAGEVLERHQVDLGRRGGPDQTRGLPGFVRVLRSEELGDRVVFTALSGAEDIVGVFGQQLHHPGLMDSVHQAGQ